MHLLTSSNNGLAIVAWTQKGVLFSCQIQGTEVADFVLEAQVLSFGAMIEVAALAITTPSWQKKIVMVKATLYKPSWEFENR